MNGKCRPSGCSRQSGFTLFEIVVVILIIGVLVTFAIDRMLQLQIDAERVSVQQVVGVLNAAVNLQAAELVVSKGVDSIRSLANTNPMQYLQELPYNYIGLKNDSSAVNNPQGNWYFDPEQEVLVYTVKNTNYFETALPGTPRIRLKVELVYENGINSINKGRVRGVTVHALDTYRWKLSGPDEN